MDGLQGSWYKYRPANDRFQVVNYPKWPRPFKQLNLNFTTSKSWLLCNQFSLSSNSIDRFPPDLLMNIQHYIILFLLCSQLIQLKHSHSTLAHQCLSKHLILQLSSSFLQSKTSLLYKSFHGVESCFSYTVFSMIQLQMHHSLHPFLSHCVKGFKFSGSYINSRTVL